MSVLAVRKMINLCKSVNKLEVGFSNIVIILLWSVGSIAVSFRLSPDHEIQTQNTIITAFNYIKKILRTQCICSILWLEK